MENPASLGRDRIWRPASHLSDLRERSRSEIRTDVAIVQTDSPKLTTAANNVSPRQTMTYRNGGVVMWVDFISSITLERVASDV